MKIIKKGTPQTIALDQSGLAPDLIIKLSIIGEDGNVVTDSDKSEIKDITLAYNPDTNKYEKTLTLSPEVDTTYVRCYFSCSTADIEHVYYPEDAKLINGSSGAFAPETVPVQYFVDYFLSIKNRLDPEAQSVVDEMVKDREYVKSILESSEGDLETDLEMYIGEKRVTEKRDNNFEHFNINLWQLQVAHPPINELVDVKITYGETEIIEVSPELFTFDRAMGLIEFLPIPGGETSGLYTMLLGRLSGLGIAILRGGILSRIPNMFEFTYKSGLFSKDTDPKEKEMLRRAICRRAFIDIKKYIDPKSERASESESIDGVSASIGNKSLELLDKLRDDETKFISKMQKKYAKTIDLVVV